MNIMPCDFIKSVNGVMGAWGLIGFPLAAFGAFLHTFSQWPGQGLWLIGGLLQPWRIQRAFLAAAALAFFGFLGYWMYFALNSFGHTNAPDSCASANEALFTFVTAPIAFLAGQALRLQWEVRRSAAAPPGKP